MSSQILVSMTEGLAQVPPNCNHLELHIVRQCDIPDSPQAMKTDAKGTASVDLSRDFVIASMRTALASRDLSTCKTRVCKFQSSNNGDLTLETQHQPHVVNFKDVREKLTKSHLLGVIDMRSTLPIVWLSWMRTNVYACVFPCTTQHNDVRNCVRREITISHDVSLFFETNMNEVSGISIYRQWIEVRNNHGLETARDIVRALTGLGISG